MEGLLRSARHPTQADTPLPAADEREDRAIPPHARGRLGLCQVLRFRGRTTPGAARLAPLLQPPPTPLCDWRRTLRPTQQRPWTSHLGETLEEMQLISKPHEVDKLVSSEEDFSEISKTLVQKYRFRVKSELAKADPFVCDPSVRESFDKIKEAVSDEWYGDFLFVVDFATERNDAEGVIRTFSEYLAKVAAITNESLSKAVEALDSDSPQ